MNSHARAPMKPLAVEPGKRSGHVCIRDMRITVQNVLQQLASGMSVEEILGGCTYLTREHIQVSLAYAAALQRAARSKVVRKHLPENPLFRDLER